ncbi:MAG TPA: antitoxin VapB family protein [Candidatus Bathyarchaeia archaeon]
MATKNLAIREEVYRKLSEAKTEGESFSDVIQKLLEKRGDLLSLWGAWRDDEEVAFIEASVKETRKKSVIRTR